jgi:hypothetical protein
MRTIGVMMVVASAILGATGCGGGESAADRAKSQGCDAVSNINTQIAKLKGLPLETSSVDTAKKALQQIQTDLNTISTAAPDVTGDLRAQLQSANATFKNEVQQTAESVTSASSLTSAAAAISTAGATLETSYQQAFAGVKC